MVQLIALMYKDQHVGTLQNLLHIWFEASLSESSEDNESNTSPPVIKRSITLIVFIVLNYKSDFYMLLYFVMVKAFRHFSLSNNKNYFKKRIASDCQKSGNDNKLFVSFFNIYYKYSLIYCFFTISTRSTVCQS